MSLPIAFRPMVVQAAGRTARWPCRLGRYAALVTARRRRCCARRRAAFRFFRDTNRMSYLHLTDGGVADNFGLSSFVTLIRRRRRATYAVLARDAVKHAPDDLPVS
jgi:hypothetical protein